MIDGRVDHDPVEPGVQAGSGLERADRSEDLDERGLGDVFGVGMVAGVLIGQAVEFPLVRLDQLAEGVRIALPQAHLQPEVEFSFRVHLHSIVETGPTGGRLADPY